MGKESRFRLGSDGVAILVLLGVVLFYLRDLVLLRGAFFATDAALQNFPLMYHVSAMFRAGQLPLWTPHLFCGYPLHAEGMAGLFYPLNLVFLLRPPALGFNVFMVLHTFLGGLFIYWLARTARISPWGSLLAGLAYSLSALLNRRYGVPNVLASLVWLPAPLALLNMWVRRRRTIWMLLGGLALGVQWLVSYPGISWLTHLALGLLVVFHLVQHEIVGLRRRLALVGAAAGMVAVGLGLGAVQLLPMSELAGCSPRGQGVSFAAVQGSGIPVQAYTTLLSPGYYGDAADASFLICLDEVSFFYVGVIPLLLVPFAFFGGSRRWGVALVILIGLGAFFSSTHFESATKLLMAFPPASLFRYRSHYAQYLVLALVLLAGYGLDRLLRSRSEYEAEGPSFRSYWWTLAGLTVLGLACTAFLYAVRGTSLVHWHFGELTADQPLIAAKIESILRLRRLDLIHLAVLWAAGLLMLALFLARRLRGRVFAVLVLGHLGINCLFFGVRPPPLVEPGYYTEAPEALALLKAEKEPTRFYSLCFYPMDPYDGEGLFASVSDIRVAFERKKQLFTGDMGLLYGLDNAEGFSHSLRVERERRLINYLAASGDTRIGNLMNIKHVLSVQPVVKAGLRLIHEGQVDVYENQRYLPRAFVVHTLVRAESESDAFDKLVDHRLDLSRQAVIECEPEAVPRVDAALDIKGTARITRYDAKHVEVWVHSPGHGLLVLTDTNYPGWVATVNNQPARIYQTDYQFRGVAVGPGDSHVVFDYRPATFWYGLVISSITLVLVACASAWTAWRR